MDCAKFGKNKSRHVSRSDLVTKALALFVLGAIKAKSIVIPRVAEELLAETEAKARSIERRLERFLSNDRVDPVKT